jgi:hypothetical protein
MSWSEIRAGAAKGVGEVGDGPGPRVPHTCTCMYRNCLSLYCCCSLPYIRVLLSETNNNEEGVEKVFNKRVWTVNDKFVNAFHRMLLLTVSE